MVEKQLDLFEKPSFEISKKGKKIYITYNKAHTIWISSSDELALRYEMVRLARSKVATSREVSQRFGYHPSTITKYSRKLGHKGIGGLQDEKRGPRKRYKRDRFMSRIRQLYRKNRKLPATEIYKMLGPDPDISLTTVRKALREIRQGRIIRETGSMRRKR